MKIINPTFIAKSMQIRTALPIVLFIRYDKRCIRFRMWRLGPVQPVPVNRVRVGRQQLSAESLLCRRSPNRHFQERMLLEHRKSEEIQCYFYTWHTWQLVSDRWLINLYTADTVLKPFKN